MKQVRKQFETKLTYERMQLKEREKKEENKLLIRLAYGRWT